ncbi:ankyrin repeat-containing domain protein [Nemania sp. FL0031]|nr:ankyrin repeat-containing domain protein [Nemania sp. FL0031]
MLLTISERGLGNQVGDTSTEQDHEGGIPLLVAAKESHSAIAGGLFDSFKPGHNRDFNNEKARGVLWNGSFALHKAVASSNDSLCRFLLRYGYEVNSVNTDHDAPIHIAAMNRARDMINFLVQHGANIKATNARGETALLLSAYAKDIDSAKLILKAAGPEQTKEFIDMPNIDHDTPLYASCCRQSEQMVQLLLDNGADPNQRCSEIRNTSLHEAVIRKNVEIIKLLLNAGADHNIRDELGLTAIDAAAEQGNADAIPAFILESPGETLQLAISKNYEEAAYFLMESDVDINETRGKYCTALQAAAASRAAINIMEKLLEKGAKVNIFGGSYGSALNAAISNDNQDAVSLLLKNDADPNIKHRGSLLIHHAVARDSVGIVKLILDRGINPNIMDEDGRPLLSYVTSTEVVDYLLSRPGVQIDETDLSLRTPLMEATTKPTPTLRIRRARLL